MDGRPARVATSAGRERRHRADLPVELLRPVGKFGPAITVN